MMGPFARFKAKSHMTFQTRWLTAAKLMSGKLVEQREPCRDVGLNPTVLCLEPRCLRFPISSPDLWKPSGNSRLIYFQGQTISSFKHG